MLVKFTVSNFLSFYSEQTIVFFPSRVRSHKEHIFKTKTTLPDILKSSIIYGPNSSGKSNLFKAISFAKNFIVFGSKNKNFINVPTHKLNAKKDDTSKFIFEIYTEGSNFEYGFEIKNGIVFREWLKRVYKNNEVLIFERKSVNNKLKINVLINISSKTKKLVIESTKAELKDNQLFLTIINAKNEKNVEKVFKTVFNWFEKKLTVIFPDSTIRGLQFGILKENKLKELYKKFLNLFDTGIDELSFHRYDLDNEVVSIPKEIKEDIKNQLEENQTITLTSKDGFERFCIERKENKFIAYKLKAMHNDKEFDFYEESDGTNRIINIIPALIMFLDSNRVILIDEIDRSLHSLIPSKIFEFFFNETKNKSSQLIATTHDIMLLDLNKFRRDEIWFIRKNANFESEIYSLEEFKTRFDKELKKAYLSGYFGAIPILD